jgi:hypothetical protein
MYPYQKRKRPDDITLLFDLFQGQIQICPFLFSGFYLFSKHCGLRERLFVLERRQASPHEFDSQKKEVRLNDIVTTIPVDIG